MFGNISWRKPALILVVILVALFLGFQAKAQDLTVETPRTYTQLDVGARVLRGYTGAVRFHVDAPGPVEHTQWRAGLGLLGEANSASWGHSRSIGYAFGQLVTSRGPWSTGLGAAQLFGDTQYSGSRSQFALSVSYRLGQRCEVTWFHMSNAGLANPNPGFDIALVGCSLQPKE